MIEKTIIITGASRGLGAAAAKIMAEMGANLVLNARSEDMLEQVAAEINESTGGSALPLAGDISEEAVCEMLVAAAIDQYGQIDAIVNNAGVIAPITPISDSDIPTWKRNIAVNLFAPFMLTRAALPHLRRTNGRVISTSSGAAVKTISGWSAYSVAKAAINHFTAMLAHEEEKITAIALRPGVVDTEMQTQIRRDGAAGMSHAEYQKFIQYHEGGMLNPPEQPGRVLAVLALFAPRTWSGEFISWEDDRIQELIRQHQ